MAAPAKVFIALPVMRLMHPRMVNSFMAAIHSAQGIHPFLHWHEGDTLIARVRNNQTTHFYDNTDCEWYVHLSDDIELHNTTRDDNVFTRLIGSGKRFIGGLYRPGSDCPNRCTSAMLTGEPIVPMSGPRRVKWLSGGLWCVHRSVMTQVRKAYPDLWYHGDGDQADRMIFGWFNEFIYTVDGRRKFFSEDYAACQRWLDIGGEIWGDTNLHLTHWGWKGYDLFEPDVAAMEKAAEKGGE